MPQKKGRTPAAKSATPAPPADVVGDVANRIVPRSGKRSAGAGRIIAAAVARMIENGEYAPGEPIREQALAERFGIGRSPVREALRMLERRCLVQIVPRKGARVSQFTDDEIIDVTLLRGVTFALAARRAAVVASKAEREAILSASTALVARAGGGNTPIAQTRDTLEIANMVLAASHSRRIIDAVLNYAHGGPAMFAPLAYVTPAARRRSAQLYLRLARALDSGNAPVAERTARQLTDEAVETALKELTSRRIADGGRIRLYGVAEAWLAEASADPERR